MRKLFAFALILLLPVAAQAAPTPAIDLLDTKAEYQADFYLRGDTGNYNGKVWHAHGKHRRDVDTAKGKQTFLLRRDTGEAYMMYPERKWYLSMTFNSVSALVGGVENMMVDRDKGVSDAIDGIAATRYETTADSPQGGRFFGRSWFTKDGILLKIEGVLRFDGQDMLVETGLRNLRQGKVAATVFDPPKNWKGLKLNGLDLASMGPQLEMFRKMMLGK